MVYSVFRKNQPIMAIFKCHGANVYCYKWPNIGQIMEPYGHTATVAVVIVWKLVTSVTRWLDYVFSVFGKFSKKCSKAAKKIAKVGSTFWQQFKPSRNSQRLLKVYQTGKIFCPIWSHCSSSVSGLPFYEDDEWVSGTFVAQNASIDRSIITNYFDWLHFGREKSIICRSDLVLLLSILPPSGTPKPVVNPIKHFTIVIYDSRVVPTTNLPIFWL